MTAETVPSFDGSTNYPHSTTGLPEVPDDVNDRAVRQVCARAADADEARQLLAMLGLHHEGQPFGAEPAEDNTDPADRPKTLDDYPSHGIGRRRVKPGTKCVAECGRALRPYGTHAEDHPGTYKHVGRGLCHSCYTRAKRAQEAAA